MNPYYDDGVAQLWLGDARDLLPSVTADVLVTDPPYGLNLGKHLDSKRRDGGRLSKQAYASYIDTPENFETQIAPAVAHALLQTKRGAVFTSGAMAWSLPRPTAIGGVFLPSACGRTKWGFNSISHLLLYGQAPAIHRGCRPTAIRSTVRAEKNGHPCPKPIEWMTWAVALASLPGEIVLDPFAGSGTTLVAAKALGRRAVGFEIEERYCEITANRLRQASLSLEGAA